MNGTDVASQWGLPPGFAPVRLPIDDAVKDVVRDLLRPDEPVVVTMANEGNSISIVATPQRLMAVRTGDTAGVTGFNVKEYPWEAITDLTIQRPSTNVTFVVSFRSNDKGRTVATGAKARLAKEASDKLMPFEAAAGDDVFAALFTIWQHRNAMAAE
jgi:hypothetical protein